jgi:tRNA1(Val) A37 N6-methylase TrmN6
MKTYYTPLQAAQVLIKHVPRSIKSILEPSVGQGVLLEPIVERFGNQLNKVFCVDIDSTVTKDVSLKFKSNLKNSLQIINADFLEWAKVNSTKEFEFDCAIMNPPYSGKLENWRKTNISDDLKEPLNRNRSVPLEGAFLINTLKFIKPGGTLLGVFPSSLISSERTNWLRKYLINEGSVKYVHELPRFTFKGVEARVYLFVYKKKANRQGNFIACNHDLLKPEKIIIPKNILLKEGRFDFSFYQSTLCFEELKNKSQNLVWKKIKDIAFIFRGSIKSPQGKKEGVHTNNFINGFWLKNNKPYKTSKRLSERKVYKGDILVKRVGRFCSQSFGLTSQLAGFFCSDCILIIRSKKVITSWQLLFTFRVMFSWKGGKHLIEKGTGACYLTAKTLREIQVPVGLANSNPSIFKEYKKAIKNKSLKKMIVLETKIRQKYGLES